MSVSVAMCLLSQLNVASVARAQLAASKSAGHIAEELCALSLNLGSADNVTVIVVQFVHS